MINQFDTIIKKDVIDGLSDWVWPAKDSGLWYGPELNWPLIKSYILEHSKGFRTVVQAGGAAGMYPRLMSQMFENVYTFEPDAYNFYCLAQNCPDTKIKKFNCALGNYHGYATFNPPSEDNRGTGSTTFSSSSAINVPVLKIDDFAFETLDLIYLDIEGSELEVLRGAVETIEKHKPLIACEHGRSDILLLLQAFQYEQIGTAHSDTFYKVKDGTVS